MHFFNELDVFLLPLDLVLANFTNSIGVIFNSLVGSSVSPVVAYLACRSAYATLYVFFGDMPVYFAYFYALGTFYLKHLTNKSPQVPIFLNAPESFGFPLVFDHLEDDVSPIHESFAVSSHMDLTVNSNGYYSQGDFGPCGATSRSSNRHTELDTIVLGAGISKVALSFREGKFIFSDSDSAIFSVGPPNSSSCEF